jgi:hypothetical protein
MRDFHMADELLTFTCKSNGAEGTYSGLVHRGLALAYGVLTLAGGSTYCGEFNRGEQDGLGCWQYTGSNIIKWTGAVRGGRREGFGELRFADGRRYAGYVPLERRRLCAARADRGGRAGRADLFLGRGAVTVRKVGRWQANVVAPV